MASNTAINYEELSAIFKGKYKQANTDRYRKQTKINLMKKNILDFILFQHEQLKDSDEIRQTASQLNAPCFEFELPTTIRDYTNKRGQTHKAHYTYFGKYLQKAKEGDKPIMIKYYDTQQNAEKYFIHKCGEHYCEKWEGRRLLVRGVYQYIFTNQYFKHTQNKITIKINKKN